MQKRPIDYQCMLEQWALRGIATRSGTSNDTIWTFIQGINGNWKEFPFNFLGNACRIANGWLRLVGEWANGYEDHVLQYLRSHGEAIRIRLVSKLHDCDVKTKADEFGFTWDGRSASWSRFDISIYHCVSRVRHSIISLGKGDVLFDLASRLNEHTWTWLYPAMRPISKSLWDFSSSPNFFKITQITLISNQFQESLVQNSIAKAHCIPLYTTG